MITSRPVYAATVAVRVPRDTGVDLATAASRRLARVPGVDSVEVRRLRGVEPALSATVVTVEASVAATDPAADAVADRLAAAPGAERVGGVEAADTAGEP